MTTNSAKTVSCPHHGIKNNYCFHKEYAWNSCKDVMCPLDPKSWTNISKKCQYEDDECHCSHQKNMINICNPDYCPLMQGGDR